MRRFVRACVCVGLEIRTTFAVVLVFLTGAFTAFTQVPQLSSNTALDVAEREYENEHFDAALTALDQYDKPLLGTFESLDLRGCIYMEQQKFDDAKKAFEDAHRANREVFAPRLHTGDLLMRQKKFEDARYVYKQLMKDTNILVSNERCRFAIMLTYLGEQNEAEAKDALDEMRFPTQTAAYYYAQAAWAFAHNKKSEAQNWLGRAASMYDEVATAWFAQHLYHFGWLKKKPPLRPLLT